MRVKVKYKLKPCPFCNNTNIVIGTSKELHGDDDVDDYAVCCNVNSGGCGACSGYSLSIGTAIKRWNKRGS